ncbi:hypothetical protein Csa_017624 [Cucumis sativus]|uniref:Uncharacterized protein n=1 Tax=Cucumis sativus TaxID=3659 RepID=A0A0A0L8W7_CUCSA|nr:hypothetical protein Csa_017624 [Cucumis sativus]
MKFLGFSLWKWQFMKLGNRIANSGSSSSSIPYVVSDTQKPPCFCCSSSSPSFKHLILKLKSQWKHHNLRWQNSTVRYSYDLQSYSLNFDDGLLH